VGVYYGLRQPLLLFTARRCLILAKTALPSKASTGRVFLALRRLCQAIPGLDRCEQHNLPVQGLMQILIAEYLHKCILLFRDSMELLGQILHFLGSRRVGRAVAEEKTSRIDPQAPGKSTPIIVQESLWSQKHNDSIRCGMSYASNT